MPPARKDPPQADDASLPSTSRSFSPALAPPPKRARTSTGGAPSTVSRRSTGGRQARIEDFIDEKELQARLLVAITETADKMIEEEEEEENEKMEIEKEVLSEAAQIVWNALAEDWATDLIAFSRHAGRETIRDDDVKLLMRRNPDMLAEILAECEGEEEGEGVTTTGTTKRKSTDGGGGRSRKEAREEEKMEIFDDVTTPRGGASSSMDSVVPETPHGIFPVAHSTPMNGRSISMIGRVDFSIPSPIGEIDEMNDRRIREGKRPNRSILDDLSATIREGNGGMKGGEGGPGVLTQELDEMDQEFAQIIDMRHPREQEEEERRMRMEEEKGEGEGEREGYPNQFPGASTNRQDYGSAESPEDGGEKKDEEHDSFDDEVIFEENENDRKGRNEDKSHRMSESSVLREMLDEEEEEKDKTVIVKKEKEKEKEDSFEDDSIQFVEEKKKNEKKVASPLPMGDFPSTSAANATVPQSGASAAVSTGVCPPTAAAPAAQATSDRSSQDSFYRDDILDDPSPFSSVAVSSSTPTVQQPTVAAAVQPARPDDYDSFDDDDDDFIAAPSRSKENNTPKAIAGPSPTITVANRWSTVEVEEVVSPAAEKKKKNENNRKVFAEDIFGMNSFPATSKPPPINKPSPTVPTRPSPAATIHQKPSPTVSTIPPPTVHPRPAVPQSTIKNTPVKKGGPSAGFSSFSFFGGDSQEEKTPTPKREDSDFVDTRSKQTTPTTNGGGGGTPKWRGGARGGRGGRGFPRKVDPNSKINRKIREQSTPVRLSPRPPSRISEVIGSFEDDDFDVSGFDD